MRLRWLQKRPPTQNNHRGVFVVIQKKRTEKGGKQAIGPVSRLFLNFSPLKTHISRLSYDRYGDAII
jgi:hypothetical protein